MNSTKVMSLRMDYALYESILIECDAKGISISDWLATQIAIAKSKKKNKEILLEKLQGLYSFSETYSTIPQRRIDRLINYVQKEMQYVILRDNFIFNNYLYIKRTNKTVQGFVNFYNALIINAKKSVIP